MIVLGDRPQSGDMFFTRRTSYRLLSLLAARNHDTFLTTNAEQIGDKQGCKDVFYLLCYL